MSYNERREARVLAYSCQYMRQKMSLTAPAEALLLAQAPLKPKNRVFAGKLLAAIAQNQEQIDGLIRKHSKNWRLDRMALTLTALLRTAIAEMIIDPQIDRAVVLDEAIEICKAYVGAESSSLANGILHAVTQELAIKPAN
ncbi:MAG: transcription antitermination factor NusB [Candidatus Lambdaproteobacteria bacterium RIFOXYD12_FULL_49_8]|uniref:Transcription antitermination factor NusB n=1 Tax=Candidatus Lambdaproteobacteria bacterium RIFOXYD2_FULL_50_16 TaxID=1817772 RepID=A0A1F6GF84_9PROT|nr:MAG: transcription antitermination factor NusB [Candidatus Lambdaproteobacteria bacterium RIFOXYD2_FULL_50_16]OGG97407.1 MAG: transcription antitermination factor NusB [Candidatus Lambdaproteobacteria bacterium RIFOXYD12_FULL_49_8]